MAGSALEADGRIPPGVGGRGASEGSDVGRVADAARGRSGRWGGDRARLADPGRAGGLPASTRSFRSPPGDGQQRLPRSGTWRSRTGRCRYRGAHHVGRSESVDRRGWHAGLSCGPEDPGPPADRRVTGAGAGTGRSPSQRPSKHNLLYLWSAWGRLSGGFLTSRVSGHADEPHDGGEPFRATGPVPFDSGGAGPASDGAQGQGDH
jgi:hypothetical protein